LRIASSAPVRKIASPLRQRLLRAARARKSIAPLTPVSASASRASQGGPLRLFGSRYGARTATNDQRLANGAEFSSSALLLGERTASSIPKIHVSIIVIREARSKINRRFPCHCGPELMDAPASRPGVVRKSWQARRLRKGNAIATSPTRRAARRRCFAAGSSEVARGNPYFAHCGINDRAVLANGPQ